jgi:hypothetical protein
VKPIRLSGHAHEQLAHRGVTEARIITTISTSSWEPAEMGRLDFPYHAIWNGKHYDTQQVRPIFVEEEAEIVVITVYSYYF